MKKLTTLLISHMLYSTASLSANTHIFLVTPRVAPQPQLMTGQTGTAIYQVTNNSNRTLAGIGLTNLPSGVTQVPYGPLGPDYCSSPLTLTAGKSCLIKLAINNSVSSGPVMCYSSTQPVYCSQPFSGEQLAVGLIPASNSCEANTSNFNAELSQAFDGPPPYDGIGWGPARTLFTPTAFATACAQQQGTSWQQQRLLAAADFWISQKLNYCQHHVPDFQTPLSQRGNIYGAPNGGYCNPVVDLAPNTAYYNQQARWNYSGSGSETASNWVNNGAMWYGFDCSNYTAWLYDFALGIQFDSGIPEQAGQTDPTSSDGPNNGGAEYHAGTTSGYLVCKDGTTDGPSSTCYTPTNPYISTIDSAGHYDPHAVTIAELTAHLQPGDLLYIAGSLTADESTPAVTHVIMWTGLTIGTGAGQVKPSQIAPDDICNSNGQWQPIIGQPVITDSHYQGPDYRMLTQCFYLDHVWAVRRPLAQ
ncbi:MAG: hypothetical protein ACHP65_08150 [Legionellales bacterium]